MWSRQASAEAASQALSPAEESCLACSTLLDGIHTTATALWQSRIKQVPHLGQLSTTVDATPAPVKTTPVLSALFLVFMSSVTFFKPFVTVSPCSTMPCLRRDKS